MIQRFRKHCAAISLVSFGLVLSSIGMQFWLELVPCALCYIQRYLLVGIGVFALIGALPTMGHRLQRFLAVCISIINLLGVGTSVHHVRLQMLPPESVPNCLPSAEYLLSNFPILEALELIFKGGQSCVEAGWSFLGISLAGWAAVVFVVLLLDSLYWAIRGTQ